MTQKRFRRLLMAKGYQRNEVNDIVFLAQRSGKPYEITYRQMALPIAFKQFDSVWVWLNKAVEKAAAAFAQLVKVCNLSNFDLSITVEGDEEDDAEAVSEAADGSRMPEKRD